MPSEPRFIAYGNLKPLVKRLRMLGVDCLYDGGASLTHLIVTAAEQNRILLTQRPLLPTIKLSHFQLLSSEPDEQLKEITIAYPQILNGEIFSRCLRCNLPLQPLDLKEKIGGLADVPQDEFFPFHKSRIPVRVLTSHSQFYFCTQCEKVFWEGSHTVRMRERLERVLGKRD
ncbi:MAG: Mut7-C RNAse domain-containing protein [bacterium]